jgi:5,10-methylenetetrahydromethanopterin reductase
LVAVAVSAEGTGFSQVTVQDNVLWASPWPLLGALAISTQRISIGSAVSNPVLMHPLEIARHAARLQELAPGRVVIGLGRGSLLSVVGHKSQADFQQLKEALQAIRACLESTDGSFDGSSFRIAQVPARRFSLESGTKLLLGGHGPRAAQLAGELADGLMVAGLWDQSYARVLRSILDSASQRAGRAHRPLLIAAPWTILETDRTRADDLARATLARSLPFIRDMAVRLGVESTVIDRVASALQSGDLKAAAKSVPHEALEAMVATEQNMGLRLQELDEAGVDMVAFAGPLSPEPNRIVHRLTAILNGIS